MENSGFPFGKCSTFIVGFPHLKRLPDGIFSTFPKGCNHRPGNAEGLTDAERFVGVVKEALQERAPADAEVFSFETGWLTMKNGGSKMI